MDEVKRESASLDETIKTLTLAIRNENSSYAESYETLEQEQTELSDLKFKEIDELNKELSECKESIQKLKDSMDDRKGLEEELKSAQAASNDMKTSSRGFIDELVSLKKVLLSFKESCEAADELFNNKQRASTGSDEETELASAIFELKQILIKKYAQYLSSDCNTQ